jgi:hypothetical protein
VRIGAKETTIQPTVKRRMTMSEAGTPEGIEAPAGPMRKSSDERKALLAQAVSNEVRNGWRIESQTDYYSYLVKGQRTSHGLHIFLSVITLGLWLPVYGLMLYFNRDQRLTITVDEWGNTNIQR